MKPKLRTKNVFERAEMTINWAKTLIGEIPEHELICLVGHCGKHYYGRYQTGLNEKEMILFDAFLKEKLNPLTVYGWLLAAQVSPNDRKLVVKKKISQKQAMRMGNAELMRKKARVSLAFLTQARKLLYNLEWRAG